MKYKKLIWKKKKQRNVFLRTLRISSIILINTTFAKHSSVKSLIVVPMFQVHLFSSHSCIFDVKLSPFYFFEYLPIIVFTIWIRRKSSVVVNFLAWRVILIIIIFLAWILMTCMDIRSSSSINSRTNHPIFVFWILFVNVSWPTGEINYSACVLMCWLIYQCENVHGRF